MPVLHILSLPPTAFWLFSLFGPVVPTIPPSAPSSGERNGKRPNKIGKTRVFAAEIEPFSSAIVPFSGVKKKELFRCKKKAF